MSLPDLIRQSADVLARQRKDYRVTPDNDKAAR